ncbi:MAG: GntR family transcriptional regulator [Candidatus Hydrogenedens sp.]|nr:GntR family transcriptional regulator [Candidatus Hydrogenedentota bacterium]NLF58893.1 GntR family transcriptional regulator [Candidatus Hydrogenedens sp.]
MRLHVSAKSGVPIYVQLVTQIRQLVAAGRLPVGSELPTIRALAEQLLVNPNTVARAYRELEQAGIVTARRGLGTVVTESGSPMGKKERVERLRDRVDGLLAEAGQLGFEFDELMELMRTRHDRHAATRGENHE